MSGKEEQGDSQPKSVTALNDVLTSDQNSVSMLKDSCLRSVTKTLLSDKWTTRGG